MRINKVKTSAFAISASSERRFIRRVEKDPKLRLYKRYAPLAKIKLVKAKGVEKGVFFKKPTTTIKRSHVYVDLTYCNIYCGEAVGVVRKNPRMGSSDILRRVMGLPPAVLTTLNYIWERGSVQTRGLNKDVLLDLARMGLVYIYEPTDSQLMNLFKMVADEKQVSQYKVKPTFYLPLHGDQRYLLADFLEAGETVDESYWRDPIRQSVKKIEETLSYLFDCEAMLEGITYLPYLVCERQGSGAAEATTNYPLCLKGSSAAKKDFPGEVRLAPISLSTELYEGESVPIEKSTITFKDIGGLEKAKREIMESIIYPFIRPDLSKKFDQKSGGGLLLYGPPGCGKTRLARAAVTECGVSFFNVNISDIMNERGNEAKRLHEVFEKASASAPSIIFFDEIDALCSRKASADEGTRKVLNQFLMDMSGVEQVTEGILVIAATNVPWELDPALRRAGRFTKQIYVPPPDVEARSEIFKVCTENKPLGADVDLHKLAELTEGYAGSDIDEICSVAARIPWKNAVFGESERPISMADFLSAIREHKSSLIPWALSAEKLIKDSNEETLYKDLLDSVEATNRRFAGSPAKQVKQTLGSKEEIEKKLAELDRKELEHMEGQKKDVEDKLALLGQRKAGGLLDENTYADMAREYQEKLLDIELKIKKLK